MNTSRLWLKLNSGVLAIVVLTMIAPLGYLFVRSRQMLKQEAMRRAEAVLDNTALQVKNHLTEVEAASRNIEWIVLDNMQPDSLLAYSRRVVEQNPGINGCSITTEPNYFPHLGRYFSAYSLREGGEVTTVREGEYEYYDKVWYKSCREAGHPVWVDPYDDFNEGTLFSSEKIASYSVPLYGADSTFLGIISTDISLVKLSKVIASATPYDQAYCMMTGKNGNFLVYPDNDRLLYHTIFDGVNTRQNPDVIALGQDMVAGHEGCMTVNMDGRQCLVFYQPVTEAGWSIALVCPEDSILGDYNRMGYTFLALLLVGLVLLIMYNRKVLFDLKRKNRTTSATLIHN